MKMSFDNQKTDDQKVVQGSRHRRLLSEAIQLEEEVLPRDVKWALLIITIFIFLFIGWSAIFVIKEVAGAPGEIIPSGSVKTVEHLEGGTVKNILVEENSAVKAGQVLIELDENQIFSERQQMQARFISLRLRGERLAAYAGERTPDFSFAGDTYPELVADQLRIYQNQIDSQQTSKSVIRSQIDQRQQELKQMQEALSVAQHQQQVTSDMVKMREKMRAKKLIPEMVFLETKRAKISADGEVARLKDQIQVTRQTVTESQRRLADLDQQLRREALAEMGRISSEIAEVRNTIERLDDRLTKTKIRAPIGGRIQDLKVLTEGQVIQPGGLVMQIVPVDAKLEAEVRIQTKDIGYVEAGQKVLVKVSSFNFSRSGGIDGTLRRLSATSHVGDNGDAYFKGWVTLSKPYVGTSEHLKVRPGMAVQADIETGTKTLLEYLIKPVTDALDRAFSER